MQKVIVLPHQSKYMTAPYLFTEKRWFFFVCGYAAGKTKANVIALLYAVKQLQGKKDRSGDYARLIVAGYTLAHLNKTFLVYLRQILDQSKSRYTENKKDNFFVIGTVTVLIVPLENPENIFGFDSAACVAGSSRVTARVSGRVRLVQIKALRPGYEVFTRKGWRKLLRVMPRGKKSVIQINRLCCTEDHKIWSDGWVEAGSLTKGADLAVISFSGVKIWESIRRNLNGLKESVRCLTESPTTGIPMGSIKAGKSIFSVLRGMARLLFYILLFGRVCTEKCRKDLRYITGMVIRLIIRLTILRLSLSVNMLCFITDFVCSTLWRRKNSGAGCVRRSIFARLRYIQGAVRSVVRTLARRYIFKNIAQEHVKDAPTRIGVSGTRKRSYFAGGAVRTSNLINQAALNSVANDAMTLINTIVELVQPSVIVRRGSVKYAGNTLSRRKSLSLLPVLRIARMLKEDKPCEVYDLTVDGYEAHEFFANGVLVHNCFVEEVDELTEDKAIEAVRSLSERCRQQIPGFRSPFLSLASTSQGQKGLYRIYNHFKKSGVGFVLIRGRTQDNVFLPKELITDMLRTYTQEEKRVFMDGEFLAIAKGRVLGDFAWERNYLDYDLDRELLPGETVHIGMDFNVSYNRASAYIVRDGVIYCVKYYDFPDPQDAPAVFRHDFPEQRILWIPDVTIRDSFPMFARELRRYGIQIIYRKKNPLVEDTVFLVNKLFYMGRLMICKIAKDVAEACALAMRDKDNRIPKGQGPGSPIHCIDGLRYACVFICMRDRAFHDIRRLIIDKRASFRPDSDKPVQDLGSGYMRIDPNALYRGKKL